MSLDVLKDQYESHSGIKAGPAAWWEKTQTDGLQGKPCLRNKIPSGSVAGNRFIL